MLPGQDPTAECAQDAPIASGPEESDDDGGPDTGEPEFSIAADPSTIVVPQGGSLSIAVTISRPAGFAESVAVTVDGLPAGVNASTVALAPDETTGTITLTSAPNAGIPRPNLARVRGHASTGTRSVALAVSVRGTASSVDSSFAANGEILTMVTILDVGEDANGKILFTGETAGNVPSICRLEVNGDPDNSFGTSGGCTGVGLASGTGQRLVLQGDKILLLGATPRPSLFVARLSADGVLDATFSANGVTEIVTEDSFRGAAIKVIGREIVVAGTVANGWPGQLPLMARLDENGAIEIGFNPEIHGSASMIADLVALDHCGFAVSTGDTLQAFKADGSSDLGFGTQGSVSLPQLSSSLTRAADGDILSAGAGMGVVRVSPAGLVEASDSPLTPGGVASSNAFRIVLDGDSAMVLGGRVSPDENRIGLGRRLGDGAPDLTFTRGGIKAYDITGSATGMVILRDGRYVLAGTTNSGYGALLRVWN
jgi:uncharacterized delta-60 repeat protein